MSAEIAIFTGCMGEHNTITAVFSDHNNVKHYVDVEINVLDQDKPRVLEIKVAGRAVALFTPNKGILYSKL